MASHPPFQVEDQTDADFFDKLVDDDDKEFSIMKTLPTCGDGNDSDEAKAFANLSISEVGTAINDSGDDGAFEAKGEELHEGSVVDKEKVKDDNLNAEDRTSIVSSNSVGFDSVFGSGDGTVRSDVIPDSTRSKSGGSSGSGVKEVQWSLFQADSSNIVSNGFGSYSDFFNDLGESANDPTTTEMKENLGGNLNNIYHTEENDIAGFENFSDNIQYQEDQVYESSIGQATDGQDLNSSQYWEDLYPGWKFDASSGQWYQVDGYDPPATIQGSGDINPAVNWAVSEGKSEISSFQQSARSVVETVAENATNGSISNWNRVSQGNTEYPAHMVFDPQYPGWYYDTIAQEWRLLEAYNTSNAYNTSSQSTVQAQQEQNLNGFASTGTFSQGNNHNLYSQYGQLENYGAKDVGNQNLDQNWNGSIDNYNQQQGLNVWQTESISKNETASDISGIQQLDNRYGGHVPLNNHVVQQKSYNPLGTISVNPKVCQGYENANGIVGVQSFVPGGNFNQQFDKAAEMDMNNQKHISNDYYSNQKPLNFSQQPLQNAHKLSYAPSVGRSSAGRPPHALVAFGFGGKLIVMKDNSSLANSSYGNQDSTGYSISILNLMELASGKNDASNTQVGTSDYFHSLYQLSFPGPLVGGNVGNKELTKWIDERILSCEYPNLDYRKGEVTRLLLSLLKIACQHYGKLRSPFGTDTALRETDCPESAVAKLFASAKRKGAQFSEYGALPHCLQKLPTEGQIRATAAEVQSLLVSGRKKEALHCAQEGHLWGPALVLAAQLGDQFYVDTVKQMALRQLVAGSPLRTLCLLVAGQPAEVFSSDGTPSNNAVPGALPMYQQTGQVGSNGMLDDWEENLAVITANRTKDDELVLIHLGDCLWKERSEIIAAHICYLVAEANFEPYSDSARLCLIGADHWKFPRTYASPDAIQRTELYEYAKVLGNSQYVLLPFQPYKLIYAHMLAEVGKVSDSLKYCQAVLRSLKTGRGHEVDTLKQLVLSLEERIKTHQQGGYATNLAPAKLVGKLLTFFDSTAHRVVGGLPPPVPSTSQSSLQGNEQYYQMMGPRVSNSQSTMAMSSLVPSSEPISEWTADSSRRTMQNRSVSEPDFGRTPRQVDSSKDAASSDGQGKATASGGSSRFVRFGFGSQLLQKTVGLVLKSRPDKQAKLGEKNKFYYDEKLKRWVEEGAELPAEEPALAPPPPTAVFQNGMEDYNLKSALISESSSSITGSPEFSSPTPSERGPGIPPIPPSSNQFSARGRMGVRSRYVDTFNQGGGNSSMSFSPSVPSVKPIGGANAKFFVPAPSTSSEMMENTLTESTEEASVSAPNAEIPSTSSSDISFQSPAPPSMTKQRFPSMNNISTNRSLTGGNGSLASHSRRTASWSGSFSNSFSPPPNSNEVKPLGEALRIPESAYMRNDPSLMQLPMNNSSGSFGDDLHEVEL